MPLGKYFYIKSHFDDDLIVEILDGIDHPAQPVVLGRADGSDHQLWCVDRSTGTIRSKMNAFCLDLDQEENVVTIPYIRDHGNQQWSLDGDRIQNADDFELVMGVAEEPGVGSPIIAMEYTSSDNQHWTFDHIPSQYFQIKSQMLHDKIVDVRKADAKPGAKVILWSDKGNKSDNQLWYEDETGIIRSKLNDFAFDATGPSLTLQPYSADNDRQQWTIGPFTLVNRDDPDEVLTLKKGGIIADHLLITQPYTGAKEQTWFIDYVPDQALSLCHSGMGKHIIIRSRYTGFLLTASADHGDGGPVSVRTKDKENKDSQLWYINEKWGTIHSALNDYVIDLFDNKVVLNLYDSFNKNQIWRFNRNIIQNSHTTDMVLAVPDDSQAEGTQIEGAFFDGNDCQLWDVQYMPAKCFYIKSRHSGYYIDIDKAKRDTGTKVILWHKKNEVEANQLWYEDERGILRCKLNGYVPDASGDVVKMRPYDPTNPKQQWIISGDRIQSKLDNTLVLDIVKASKSKSSNLCSFKFHGKDNQRWIFEYLES